MAINNPALLASFDANQTNTQTLPASQVTDGYAANEIPLSEHHGFMFNEFYKYLNHLKETGISQWDSTVSYSQHSRIMRDGVIYKSTQDANQGNDPLSTSLWLVDMWMNQTTTHNITTDSDYTLTAAQNGFGRIVITDTGTILTVPRNIIVDDSQKSFIVKNNTLQDLTFKTTLGTGIVIKPNGSISLYNDGTNVIYIGNEIGVNQSWQDVSGSRSLETPNLNDTGRTIKVSVTLSIVGGTASGDVGSAQLLLSSAGVANPVAQMAARESLAETHTLYLDIPNGETYTISDTSIDAGSVTVSRWHELR